MNDTTLLIHHDDIESCIPIVKPGQIGLEWKLVSADASIPILRLTLELRFSDFYSRHFLTGTCVRVVTDVREVGGRHPFVHWMHQTFGIGKGNAQFHMWFVGMDKLDRLRDVISDAMVYAFEDAAFDDSDELAGLYYQIVEEDGA